MLGHHQSPARSPRAKRPRGQVFVGVCRRIDMGQTEASQVVAEQCCTGMPGKVSKQGERGEATEPCARTAIAKELRMNRCSTGGIGPMSSCLA